MYSVFCLLDKELTRYSSKNHVCTIPHTIYKNDTMFGSVADTKTDWSFEF